MPIVRPGRLAPREGDFDDHTYARPRRWRQEAVLDLWLAGWPMKDCARLSDLSLVEVARIVGDRVRKPPAVQLAGAGMDSALDVLDRLRKGRAVAG